MSEIIPSPTGTQKVKAVIKRHLFSLRAKFILVLTILICGVMGVVSWLIQAQMRGTLIQQVLERGESEARSLALNSVDPMIKLPRSTSRQQSLEREDSSLVLLQLTHDAMNLGTNASDRDISSGLNPFQEKLLLYTNLADEWVRQFFWPDESEVKKGDMEYIKILDKNRNIVADNNIQNVMGHVAYQQPPGTRPLGKEEPILTQAYRQGNRTYYDIAVPISTKLEGKIFKIGEVHLGMNQNTIIRVVRYVGVAILMTTVGILLLGILGMTVFVSILVKPIRLLVKGVSAIAAGNFAQKIDIHRSDELGDLTEAFNDMAKSLMEKEEIKGAFFRALYMDPMTGLYSKAAVDAYLPSFRTKTLAKLFFICRLDIDFFKSINDCLGHEIGDQVIVAFGNMLKAHFPNRAFRVGGDEFLWVFEGTETEVLEKAKRFRESVEKNIRRTMNRKLAASPIRNPHTNEPIFFPWNITCSQGIAEWSASKTYLDAEREADTNQCEAKLPTVGKNAIFYQGKLVDKGERPLGYTLTLLYYLNAESKARNYKSWWEMKDSLSGEALDTILETAAKKADEVKQKDARAVQNAVRE